MKLWIPMLTLALAVVGLCVWDTIHTSKVLSKMESESSHLHTTLLSEDITDPELQKKINDLNDYWTKKMDILSISISRKDMQPISDYLQYLCSSIINNNQEDAITYSRLLNYNVTGLYETIGISFVNLI